MKMLRQRRKERGLTMKQLGEFVGVSEAAISNYENGRRQADFETLLKIGDALDCSVDYLLRGEDDQEQQKTPTPEPRSGRTEEFVELFEKLDERGQKDVISALKGILSEQE